MKFCVAPEVFNIAPDFCVGVVVAMGLDNRRSDPSIAALLADEVSRARIATIGRSLESERSIAVWRRAFARAGIDAERYPSAIEALLRRVLQGDDIPQINPAVDLANAMSLRYRVPIGAHDIDRLTGDMQVRISRPNDRFVPRGRSDWEQVPPGEVVYADDAEVRTRRWVWRLGERAKVTGATRTVFFPVDGFRGTNDSDVRAATAELAELLRNHLGANTRQYFVDRDNPVADLGVEPRPYDDPIDRLLTRGVVEVLPSKEDLERRLRSGQKIRIYIGVDPTSPIIHLGHAVQLRKLRQFQDLGNKVILLVGDFTGRIGDPSDKSAARVQLTKEQVEENAKTYSDQAAKILDFTSPVNPVELRFNSEWWDAMSARDMIELSAYFTVQQMLQREMFQKRLEENKPVGLHEFLYPLLQGYDSVAMNVDAELGGTDQTFNMLIGRDLVKAINGKEKFVVTGPLLEGTDGRKMSKSYGNVIGIADPPYDMYGKIMSLRDELIVRYFELLTDAPDTELAEMTRLLQEQAVNPMVLKKRLAFDITSQFHGTEAASRAAERFEREIQRREIPEEVPTVTLPAGGTWSVIDLLTTTNLAASRSEARRLIEQGAVYLDGERVTDARAAVEVREGMTLRGRRRQFVRLAVPPQS